jgi:hypothetical protein
VIARARLWIEALERQAARMALRHSSRGSRPPHPPKAPPTNQARWLPALRVVLARRMGGDELPAIARGSPPRRGSPSFTANLPLRGAPFASSIVGTGPGRR